MLGALRIDGHFQPDQKMIEEVNDGRLFDMKRLDCVEILLRDSSVVWSVEAFPDAGLTKNDDGTAALTLKDIEEYRVLNGCAKRYADTLWQWRRPTKIRIIRKNNKIFTS